MLVLLPWAPSRKVSTPPPLPAFKKSLKKGNYEILIMKLKAFN
jgi:hypothetical protein